MLDKDVDGRFENDVVDVRRAKTAIDVNGVRIISEDGQATDERVWGSRPVEGWADSQGFEEEDMVRGRLTRNPWPQSEAHRWDKNSEAVRWGVAINRQIGISRFPGECFVHEDARCGTKMPDEPHQVFAHSLPHIELSLGPHLPGHFGITVGKARLQQWENVQRPVDPAGKALELAEFVPPAFQWSL
jgi:hypothetical protein